MPTPSKGLHVPFIKSRLPDWTRHLHGAHLQAMTRARDPAQRFIKAHPAVFAQASSVLRQGLLDSQMQSTTSSQQLAKTLKDFQGITEFCKPLLTQALRTTFGQAPDPVATHLFHLRAPNTVDQQSLLQAALRNFEADEPFDEVSLQETSALAPEGSLEMHLYDETRTYPFGKTRYSIRDSYRSNPRRSPACAGNWTWAGNTRST
ncbi:dermonecrotic toxin domain-containing protein [Pseudomonas marginalis]